FAPFAAGFVATAPFTEGARHATASCRTPNDGHRRTAQYFGGELGRSPDRGDRCVGGSSVRPGSHAACPSSIRAKCIEVSGSTVRIAQDRWTRHPIPCHGHSNDDGSRPPGGGRGLLARE